MTSTLTTFVSNMALAGQLGKQLWPCVAEDDVMVVLCCSVSLWQRATLRGYHSVVKRHKVLCRVEWVQSNGKAPLVHQWRGVVTLRCAGQHRQNEFSCSKRFSWFKVSFLNSLCFIEGTQNQTYYKFLFAAHVEFTWIESKTFECIGLVYFGGHSNYLIHHHCNFPISSG